MVIRFSYECWVCLCEVSRTLLKTPSLNGEKVCYTYCTWTLSTEQEKCKNNQIPRIAKDSSRPHRLHKAWVFLWRRRWGGDEKYVPGSFLIKLLIFVSLAAAPLKHFRPLIQEPQIRKCSRQLETWESSARDTALPCLKPGFSLIGKSYLNACPESDRQDELYFSSSSASWSCTLRNH